MVHFKVLIYAFKVKQGQSTIVSLCFTQEGCRAFLGSAKLGTKRVEKQSGILLPNIKKHALTPLHGCLGFPHSELQRQLSHVKPKPETDRLTFDLSLTHMTI